MVLLECFHSVLLSHRARAGHLPLSYICSCSKLKQPMGLSVIPMGTHGFHPSAFPGIVSSSRLLSPALVPPTANPHY